MTAARTHLVAPLGLALACGALAVLAQSDPLWHRWLDYRRGPVAAGQAWRLVTAHAMHLSAEHAVLDIAALLLVAWIFGTALRPLRQFVVGVVAIVCIDADLWYLHPEVDRYVGLSGILHAGFVAGAVSWLAGTGSRSGRGERRTWGVLLSLAVAGKLVLEAERQAFWLSPASFAVVTAAHRSGALAGLVCGLGWALSRGPSARASAASPVRPPRG